ncbi:hypothetical protein H8E77_10185 [bacterium]|nr:hypothetical protein [bacterium]
MTVGQVIEIAKEYVDKEASQVPGFCGAFLVGGINGMPKEAPFPLYRDVDIYMPVEDVKQIPIPQRKLPYKQGKSELHEEILRLLGCVHMDRGQVESYLQECVTAFDRAVEVKRTPFSGSYNVDSCVRPYLVEGALEMINEGNHREAMFWIWIFHYCVNVAIQNDGSEEEKPQYQAGYDDFLSGLGLHAPNDWQSRLQLARNVAEQFFEFADEVVENHPDIIG